MKSVYSGIKLTLSQRLGKVDFFKDRDQFCLTYVFNISQTMKRTIEL